LMFSFIAIYVLGIFRASIRQNMARRLITDWRTKIGARRFDLFAWPITGLFAAVMLICSSVGNRISWSNIHYLVEAGGRTMVLGRNVESQSWPVRTAPIAPKPNIAKNRRQNVFNNGSNEAVEPTA